MSGDLCCPGRPTIPRDICCLITHVARSCKVNGADDEGATRGMDFPCVGASLPPASPLLRSSSVPMSSTTNLDRHTAKYFPILSQMTIAQLVEQRHLVARQPGQTFGTVQLSQQFVLLFDLPQSHRLQNLPLVQLLLLLHASRHGQSPVAAGAAATHVGNGGLQGHRRLEKAMVADA